LRLEGHLEQLIQAGVDGRADHRVEAVEELAPIDGGQALVEVPAYQLIEGVGLRVGLGGDLAVDDRQDIAGVNLLPGPLDALRLLGLVVVELIGGGDVDAID
jgi:hypothetical protein